MWGGNNNINGLPVLNGVKPRTDPRPTAYTEIQYEPRYEPEPEEPQKHVPTAFDEDPTQAWSDDAVQKNMKAFKTVKFHLYFKNRGYLATMLFATPEVKSHTSNIPSTIQLGINAPSTVSASFMFSQNIHTNVSKVLSEFIKQKTVIKDVYKGEVPEKPSAVMIKALSLYDIKTNPGNCPPIGIKIGGIEGKFVVPHRVSWNSSIAYATVVTSREDGLTVYESGSTAAPELEAIHGTGDCSKPTAENLGLWGRLSDNCVSVPIMSEKGMFLCYYLADLIRTHLKEKKKLPQDMTQEQYDAVQQCHAEWQAKTREAGLPVNIYSPYANLADGHMGMIIDIFSATESIPWSIHSEDPFFRVPLVFVKFLAPKYDSHILGVVMTNINAINMSAHYDNPEAPEAVPKGSTISFNVRSSVFVPRMFYTIEPLE